MTDELDIPRSLKCFDCIAYIQGDTCPLPYWCDIADGTRNDYPNYQSKKSKAKE